MHQGVHVIHCNEYRSDDPKVNTDAKKAHHQGYPCSANQVS